MNQNKTLTVNLYMMINVLFGILANNEWTTRIRSEHGDQLTIVSVRPNGIYIGTFFAGTHVFPHFIPTNTIIIIAIYFITIVTRDVSYEYSFVFYLHN